MVWNGEFLPNLNFEISHGVFLFCISENEKGGKTPMLNCGRYGKCAENISKLNLFFVMCLHQTKVTTVYHTLLTYFWREKEKKLT